MSVLLAIALAIVPHARATASIADILDNPPTQVGEALPASLRGIVTFRRTYPEGGTTLTVQEGERAVWVYVPPTAVHVEPENSTPIEIGEAILVTGHAKRGAYAPLVIADNIRRRGRAELPRAAEFTSARTFSGLDSGVRAELTGIVQGVRKEANRWQFLIYANGRRFSLLTAEPWHDVDAESFVDATVRAVGVIRAIRNTRGEFIGPALAIAGPNDVEIIERSPSPPFESPRVPLDAIARYAAVPLAGHRFQTEGTVTAATSGHSFYLQSGQNGVRVETTDPTDVLAGDMVRVAGFLDMSGNSGGISGAVVERTRRGIAPTPTLISPRMIIESNLRSERRGREDDLDPSDYAGGLVTLNVKLMEKQRTLSGGSFVLAIDDAIVSATMPHQVFDALEWVAVGSELAVTGICQLELQRRFDDQRDWQVPAVQSMALLVNSAADVRLVRAPAWWTPQRLRFALAAAVGVLSLVLTWSWSLRRQVAAQAVAIAAEVRSRRESAVEFQATIRERNRLAANLHDTLLQTMAGVGFQLEACHMAERDARAPASALRTSDHLDVARRMIDHAVSEIRGSVWALRSTAVQGQSLMEAIDGLLKQLSEGHGARMRAHVTGQPFDLPNFVTGNLLLIVQEAIHNALHHGRPETIEIGVAFSKPTDSVEVAVRDDGVGFTMGTQRGPSDGHFGLQGMRERAERLRGKIAVETSPGHGTVVRVQAHCTPYDSDVEKKLETGEQLADPPMAHVHAENVVFKS